MNILYVWDADYPWDIRVEKICHSLFSNGHSVHIASRNLRKRPTHENINGLHIHRIKPRGSDKVNYATSFPAFFSPIWRSFLNGIIHNHNIDLIIVRDLPLAIAGIWQGKKFDIPVILDMAEDYVALIKDIWEDDKFKGFNLVVRNPYLAKLVERYTFKNIDHIFVVVKEASELLKVRGVDTRKITIVGNTPLLTLIENIESPPDEITNAMHDRYTAIYTGGIQLGRGIQLVLDAIPEIVKFIPNFLFVVIGDGYATNQLKQLIQEKGLQNYVLWAGWIDHSNLFNYLRKSDIGLIPHYTSDHVNTTIPNKIFDYMGCGLPVVASDSAPMKRIIDEEKCGITFKSGNVQDLADKVVQISKFKLEMGENGKMAIKQKYNWEYDEQRLLNAITNLSLD